MVRAKIVTSTKLRNSVPPTYKIELSTHDGKTLYAYIQESQINTALECIGSDDFQISELCGVSAYLYFANDTRIMGLPFDCMMSISIQGVEVAFVCVFISEE